MTAQTDSVSAVAPARTEAPRPPRHRTFWRLVGAVAAIGTVAVAALQIAGLLSSDSTHVVRSVAADGVTAVVVRADDGDITVVGSATDEIAVDARIRRSLGDPDVEVQRSGGSAVVTGTCPGFSPGACGVDMVVTVPDSVSVEVHGSDGDVTVRHVGAASSISVVDGDVTVEDARGPLDVEVGDGVVTGSALAGRAVVRVGNGDVGLSFATAPASVEVGTGSGEIAVVVPDDPATYRIDAESNDGRVDTPVRTDPDSDRTVLLRSGDGDVTVRYPA